VGGTRRYCDKLRHALSFHMGLALPACTWLPALRQRSRAAGLCRCMRTPTDRQFTKRSSYLTILSPTHAHRAGTADGDRMNAAGSARVILRGIVLYASHAMPVVQRVAFLPWASTLHLAMSSVPRGNASRAAAYHTFRCRCRERAAVSTGGSPHRVPCDFAGCTSAAGRIHSPTPYLPSPRHATSPPMAFAASERRAARVPASCRAPAPRATISSTHEGRT